MQLSTLYNAVNNIESQQSVGTSPYNCTEFINSIHNQLHLTVCQSSLQNNVLVLPSAAKDPKTQATKQSNYCACEKQQL